MSLQKIIEQKLKEAFEPSYVQVVNESHLHKGHAGDNGTGESHFAIEVVSNVFEGVGRAQRHRLVYDLFQAELQSSLHALSIKTSTPQEYEQ